MGQTLVCPIIYTYMRTRLFFYLLASPLLAQTGTLGVFTNSGDVGNPAIKGSTVFDAAKGEYRMTGAGVNMWATADQFQYVWKELSGNVAVTANVEFLGEGAMHRKAAIMLRKSLDTDSPYVDVTIHGNGMPAIQWRNNKGEITNGVDFPFDSPGKFKLKLVRTVGSIGVWVAKDGGELKEIGHTTIQLGNPILVGLAVCSHQPNHSDTVVFSNVSVEALATAPAKTPAKKKQ